MKSSIHHFWEASLELHESGVAFSIVTLTHIRGHAPQEMGAKMLVTSDGRFWGTVGGGNVEARAIEHAQALLKALPNNQTKTVYPPETLTWNLQRDVGMTCGGEVTFLFEIDQRAKGWSIVVFGAGHVAQALIRTLDTLNCKITCVDSRQEWLEKLPNSPKLTKICVPDLREYLNNADPNSYFTIMTKGHALDFEMLEAIYTRFPKARYVGCIGSDVKTIKLRTDLKAKGIAPEVIENLHCPIGLDIGTNDPHEIAISIAAQLLQVRDLESKL